MMWCCEVEVNLTCLLASSNAASLSASHPQEPKYAAYMELFEPLCGPAGPSRPLMVGDAVEQKASWGAEAGRCWLKCAAPCAT